MVYDLQGVRKSPKLKEIRGGLDCSTIIYATPCMLKVFMNYAVKIMYPLSLHYLLDNHLHISPTSCRVYTPLCEGQFPPRTGGSVVGTVL